jgi:hypothetical protein
MTIFWGGCSAGVQSSLTVLSKSIAVIGVDVEAEDRIDFDGLGAASGRAEFPVGKRSYDFCGHGRGAGLEDLKIF